MRGAEVREAREGAPELVALAEEAIEEAESSERSGDEAGAADLATRARLILDAAVVETARVRDESRRASMEREIAEILEQARRDESARVDASRALSRAAAARVAREETRRALELAASDEARPARRQRVSLDDAPALARAAAALRARARLTVAAARALGANEETLRSTLAALETSEAASNAMEAISHADRARHEALGALGAVRAGQEGPGRDGPSTLAEAARAESFDVIALPEGMAVETAGLFRGRSASLGSSARTRLAQLVSLLAAHPHGPVQVQAQVAQGGRAGDQLASRRAEALRRALVAAGVDASRLSAQPLPSALRGDVPIARTRLVFVAYAVVQP